MLRRVASVHLTGLDQERTFCAMNSTLSTEHARRFFMTQMNAAALRASDPLRVYMILSFDTLRDGMWIFTAAFPVAVYVAGLFYGQALPGSLSAYYWLIRSEPNIPRIILVGGLLAFALVFLLYRGFTKKENRALNAAAAFAAGVAFIPKADGAWDPGYWHGGSAVALFLCLAYVMWFRAKDTFEEFQRSGEAPPAGKGSLDWYKKHYKIAGGVMAASPVIAVTLDMVVGKWLGLGDPDLGKLGTIIFFIESVGIWAFARYWFLKRSEIRQSAALKELLTQARKEDRAV
jgi:hypothetical protein